MHARVLKQNLTAESKYDLERHWEAIGWNETPSPKASPPFSLPHSKTEGDAPSSTMSILTEQIASWAKRTTQPTHTFGRTVASNVNSVTFIGLN